jgi:hypothetical protein
MNNKQYLGLIWTVTLYGCLILGSIWLSKVSVSNKLGMIFDMITGVIFMLLAVYSARQLFKVRGLKI